MTFGGVTDSSPPDSRSKAGIDGSRSVSESLAFLACFTCANWLPLPALLGAGRPKFLFWLHHFTVCCARGALKRRGGTIHSTLASRALLTSHRPICNPPPLPFVAFMFPGFLIVLLCAVHSSNSYYSLVGFSDEAVHHSQSASSQHSRRGHRNISRRLMKRGGRDFPAHSSQASFWRVFKASDVVCCLLRSARLLCIDSFTRYTH